MEGNHFVHNQGCNELVSGAVFIHCSVTPGDKYTQFEFEHPYLLDTSNKTSMDTYYFNLSCTLLFDYDSW